MLTDDTLMVRNPDLVATDMGGELVMMSVERGEYYGLGGVGPRLWHWLASPQSIHELCDAVCAEFEVDAARCHADVRAFVSMLLDKGLLRTC